jgi:hypothetical protein
VWRLVFFFLFFFVMLCSKPFWFYFYSCVMCFTGGLAEDVEAGIVGATRDEKEDQPLDPRRVSKYLRKQHGWDALAVRSIWSFGPDIRGPNVLLGKFPKK